MVAFGDYGMVQYAGSVRRPDSIVAASSLNPGSGGNDVLSGGSGNDVLIGGFGNEVLSSGRGNDVLIGDSGEVLFVNGRFSQASTTDFLVGGADTLISGAGNDVLLGGFGKDVFIGNLSRDVMIGDNGRITMHNGKVTTVVTFAQAPQDVIASTLFHLYDSPYADVAVTLPRAPLDLILGARQEAPGAQSATPASDRRDMVGESSYLGMGGDSFIKREPTAGKAADRGLEVEKFAMMAQSAHGGGRMLAANPHASGASETVSAPHVRQAEGDAAGHAWPGMLLAACAGWKTVRRGRARNRTVRVNFAGGKKAGRPSARVNWGS